MENHTCPVGVHHSGANAELHASLGESTDSALKGSNGTGKDGTGLNKDTAAHVGIPTEIAARVATLGSRWHWLNWAYAALLPA